MTTLRLGVNIDHVATIRNARGGKHPCPVRAALVAKEAGADGITAHLREDRRHIKDADMERLKAEVDLPLNFEMAATEEMIALALRIKPNACCLVPEKREELTTEGGLDVLRLQDRLREDISRLREGGIRVSLFVDPMEKQLEAARNLNADIVELHTGEYAEAALPPLPLGEGWGEGVSSRSNEMDSLSQRERELQRAAIYAHSLGLEVHAGHGLTFENVAPIAAIPEIIELNIGHFLIGEAIFTGLDNAISKMRHIMDNARGKKS